MDDRRRVEREAAVVHECEQGYGRRAPLLTGCQLDLRSFDCESSQERGVSFLGAGRRLHALPTRRRTNGAAIRVGYVRVDGRVFPPGVLPFFSRLKIV